MRQAIKARYTPRVPLFVNIRLLWPLLLLLAAFVFFLEFIADVGGNAEPPPSSPEEVAPGSPTPAGAPFPDTSFLPQASVLRVLDGGTLEVSIDGDRVVLRYYGSDAPAKGERCFGAAKEANQGLVRGETVRLLSGSTERDEAGHLLRYVFLENGESVEGSLLAQGVATASTQEGPYRDYFVQLEEAARAGGVGCLWAP